MIFLSDFNCDYNHLLKSNDFNRCNPDQDRRGVLKRVHETQKKTSSQCNKNGFK